MTAKQKPQVGQTLYSLNIGNNARYCEQRLIPVVVSKVGRKYFTVKQARPYSMETEYHLDDWVEKTEYCPNSRLYISEQEWAEEKEARELCQHFADVFRYGRNSYNLPIDALRAIAVIVGQKEARP